MKTDQTEQMPGLIRVFAGHTFHFVGFVMRQLIFSRDCSYHDMSIFQPTMQENFAAHYISFVLFSSYETEKKQWPRMLFSFITLRVKIPIHHKQFPFQYFGENY